MGRAHSDYRFRFQDAFRDEPPADWPKLLTIDSVRYRIFDCDIQMCMRHAGAIMAVPGIYLGVRTHD